MIIGTNDSSQLAGPVPGSTPSLDPIFNTRLDLGTVTGPTPSTVAGHVTLMVINLYTTFYYRKSIIVEDLISSKLFMKKIV